MRGILDSLAEHVFALHEAVGRINAIAANMVAEDDTDPATWGGRVREMADRIRDENKAAGDEIERLRLRLGPEGDRLVQYATMMRVRSDTVRYCGTWDISNEVVEKIAAERDGIDQVRKKFMAQALKFTEARLHKAPAEGASGSQGGSLVDPSKPV